MEITLTRTEYGKRLAQYCIYIQKEQTDEMPGRYDKLASAGNACAPLQYESLVTQLACFVNSQIVLAHACCVSSDNTILVLKLCVLVPDYFQAFLLMCTVGAVALLA